MAHDDLAMATLMAMHYQKQNKKDSNMKFKNKDWVVIGDKNTKKWFVEELKENGFNPSTLDTDYCIKNSDNIHITVKDEVNEYYATDEKEWRLQNSDYFKIFYLPEDWNKAIKYIMEKEPEIELNNWYWTTLGSLYYINKKDNDHLFGYGVAMKQFIGQRSLCNIEYIDRKATKDEVEKELIKEAKRKYNEGDLITSISDRFIVVNFCGIHYQEHPKLGENCLYNGDDNTLFCNGKWAEVIEKKEERVEYLVNDFEVKGHWDDERYCYDINIKPIIPITHVNIETDYKKLYDKLYHSVAELLRENREYDWSPRELLQKWDNIRYNLDKK